MKQTRINDLIFSNDFRVGLVSHPGISNGRGYLLITEYELGYLSRYIGSLAVRLIDGRPAYIPPEPFTLSVVDEGNIILEFGRCIFDIDTLPKFPSEDLFPVYFDFNSEKLELSSLPAAVALPGQAD